MVEMLIIFKMVIIVEIKIMVDMVIIRQYNQDTRDKQDRQNNQDTGQTGQTSQRLETGQTDLTCKLDFPSYLCRTTLAIFAMFYF